MNKERISTNELICVVIDDEIYSLELIKSYFPSIDVPLSTYYFTSSKEAYNFIQQNPVDIIISDIEMPLMSGIHLQNLTNNTISTIYMSGYDYPVSDILRSNIIDFLSKPFSETRFIEAIFKAISINRFSSFLVLQEKIAKYYGRLSNREKEIVKLISEGLKNKHIADKLNISVKTVEVTKYNICQKLELKDSISLLLFSFIKDFPRTNTFF